MALYASSVNNFSTWCPSAFRTVIESKSTTLTSEGSDNFILQSQPGNLDERGGGVGCASQIGTHLLPRQICSSVQADQPMSRLSPRLCQRQAHTLGVSSTLSIGAENVEAHNIGRSLHAFHSANLVYNTRPPSDGNNNAKTARHLPPCNTFVPMLGSSTKTTSPKLACA
jgi:hypothetical protein